jgi:PadR family transcriptional regulator, regulatory protein AphA
MKLEHLLLGVLLEKPRTGYDLKKFFDTQGRFLRSNTQMSQVYRSLAAIEDRGWVEHSVEERPGAVDAKIFRVTADGAVVFLDWLTGTYSPPTRWEDPEFNARLYFAAFMGLDATLRLLDVELESRRSQIARFRFRDRTHMIANADVPVDAPLGRFIDQRSHDKGTHELDAHVAWIERVRAELLDGVPHETRPLGAARS